MTQIQTTFYTGADNVNQDWSVQIEVSCEKEPGNEVQQVQGVVLPNFTLERSSDLEVYVKIYCFNETHHAVNSFGIPSDYSPVQKLTW